MRVSLKHPLLKDNPLVISIYEQYWEWEGFNPPPPPMSVRITDINVIRITDSGDTRITD